MQVRNNYEKDVFNGDMGRIVFLDSKERTLSVSFDERVVPYDFEELDELAPAYAISIHKSQGSRALHLAVKNNKTRKRYTRLAWRLAPQD